MVGLLNARFFEVDELVDGCQPLHVLRLGLLPQRLSSLRVTGLHLRNDGPRAGHGLGFGTANTGIQRRQLRRRTHTVDQFFQRRGRLGVKIGQRRDGGNFFVALGRRGAEHHIAHGNRAVMRRTTEVDGVALHLHVDVVVVAQCLVNAADFDHSHPRDHDQQRQNQTKPRIQASCDGHTREKHGELLGRKAGRRQAEKHSNL